MECQVREWLCYNFAAGSFHTNKLVADFIRLKLNFIKKQKNRFMSHRLGNLGVTYALNLQGEPKNPDCF